MRKQKKYTTDIPKAKYLFGIKIYYSDGVHKYANLFDAFSLKLGMNIGAIYFPELPITGFMCQPGS